MACPPAQRLPVFVPGFSPVYQSCPLGNLRLGPVHSCLHFPLALTASPHPTQQTCDIPKCPAPRVNPRRFQRKKTVPHVLYGVETLPCQPLRLPSSPLCCVESERVIFALNGLVVPLLMFGHQMGQTGVYVGTNGQREHRPLRMTGPLALLKGKLRDKRAGGLPGRSRGMVERGFT